MSLYKDFQKLSSLRLSASYLLAYSMIDLFSESKLISGGVDSFGFYYDFLFPYPVNEELLDQIQQRMHYFQKKELSLNIVEMVPTNAIEYLKHLNRHYDLEDLLYEYEEKSLVSLVKCDGFADVCHRESCEEFSSIKNFQLTEVEKLEDHRIRIRGTAFFDKKSLKRGIKNLKNYQKARPSWIKPFFYEDQDSRSCVWLPKGISIKNFLKEKLQQYLEEENFIFLEENGCKEKLIGVESLERMFPVDEEAGLSRFAQWKQEETVDLEEGLIKYLTVNEILHERIFCTTEKITDILSESIDSVMNFLKILGLNVSPVLFGHGKYFEILKGKLNALNLSYEEEMADSVKLEFYFNDTLGRFFAGPFIEVNCSLCEKKGLSYSSWVIVDRSLIGFIENLSALIIEKGQGQLPFSLCPEQVRIIPIEGDTARVKQVFDLCLSLGLRVKIDKRNVDSRMKSQQGAKEKIPFLVFVKEDEKDLLFVREDSSLRAKEMSVETFIDKVQSKRTERHFED